MGNNVSKHHSDSLYYECLAKIILENRFKTWNLEVFDRPDLQDNINKIGIEVTRILPEGCNQAISLMNSGKIIDGKLKDEGYDLYMRGFLRHPTKEWERGKPFPTFNYLINGIKNKIEKIKNYRKDYKEIDLFVFTDNLDLDNDTIAVIFSKISEINNGTFDSIFISACYKVFHLELDYAGSYEINIDEFNSYQEYALEMEEDIKNE